MKIGIIGGGAAGLVAAINSKSFNNDVVILERNNVCGKKILVTGNGKCNFWNADQNLIHYQSSSNKLIKELINKDTESLVINFFNFLGIVPKIKNGYYYPNSNQALTIKEALVEECLDRNIIIKNNYLVEKIEKVKDKFIINDELYFDKIIISTGSCAASFTGTDGMGYRFLKQMGHTIVKPLPALVQLNTKKYMFLKRWKGVRTDVCLSLIEDGKKIKDESGEIQLTDYGISGICVFNLSNEVARGLDDDKKEEIIIDFLPNLTDKDLENYLTKDKPVKRLLSNLLNIKLVDIILTLSNINNKNKYKDLDNIRKNKIIKLLKEFNVEIESTKSFDNAQVCSGGVSLAEINLHTMESKLVPNLYIVGELLDLTGECGGYNLGIAWRSGIVCGLSIRGEDND